MVSRRRFLTISGATAAAIVTPTVSATPEDPVTEEDGADHDWLPEHVHTVGDDPDDLENYAPSLITTREERSRMQGLYGIWMDSADHDERAYMYWLRYSHQDSLVDGIPILGEIFAADAHLGDHEPFVAFVDRQTGEVTQTIYTGYHHYAVHLEGDEINLTGHVFDTRDTHVPLEVISPHHHYRLGDSGRGALASNITSMESFLEAYPRWRDRGTFDSSSKIAVTDPWYAKQRGTGGIQTRFDARVAQIRVLLNLRDRDTLIRD